MRTCENLRKYFYIKKEDEKLYASYDDDHAKNSKKEMYKNIMISKWQDYGYLSFCFLF